MGLSVFSMSYIKQALFLGGIALSLSIMPAVAAQNGGANIQPIDRSQFDIAPVIPDLNRNSNKIESLPKLEDITNSVSDLSEKTNLSPTSSNQNAPMQLAQAGISDGSKASTAGGATSNSGTSSAVVGSSDGTGSGTASSGSGTNNAGNASSQTPSPSPSVNGAGSQADSKSNTPQAGTSANTNTGANAPTGIQPSGQLEGTQQNPEAAASASPANAPAAGQSASNPSSSATPMPAPESTPAKTPNTENPQKAPEANASPANAPAAGQSASNPSSAAVTPPPAHANSGGEQKPEAQKPASNTQNSGDKPAVQLNKITPEAGSGEKGKSETPQAENKKQDLPQVHVLTMGGTIAGKKTDEKVGYEAAVLTGQQMVETIPELGQLAHLDVKEIAQIASQNITLGHWKTLAESIKHIRAEENSDKQGKGIVITHGTDTMAMTAFFLSMIFPSGEPIVLTGSMRPSDAVGADGPANLKDAVALAKSEEAKNRGPLILLNQKIYSARHVVKMNPQTVEAFVDLHQGPVGEMTKDGAVFYAAANTENLGDVDLKTFFHDQKSFPKVGIFYQHPDADISLIQQMVDDGYKGIVLAGVGHGNVSDAGWPLLEKAAKKGIIVVRSSQAQGGIVSRNGEINDDEKGFIASLDLAPQNARILTQLALMAGYKTPQEIQSLFSQKAPFSKK